MVGDSGIIYLSSKHEPTKTRHAIYDKVRIKQNLMKPISGRNSTIKNHSANHNLLQFKYIIVSAQWDSCGGWGWEVAPQLRLIKCLTRTSKSGPRPPAEIHGQFAISHPNIRIQMRPHLSIQVQQRPFVFYNIQSQAQMQVSCLLL